MKLNTRILFFLSLLFFTYLMISFFTGKRGFREIMELNSKRNLVKREILELNRKNQLLLEKVRHVRYESTYIEKMAREELDMVKTGEQVYKFSTRK